MGVLGGVGGEAVLRRLGQLADNGQPTNHDEDNDEKRDESDSSQDEGHSEDVGTAVMIRNAESLASFIAERPKGGARRAPGPTVLGTPIGSEPPESARHGAHRAAAEDMPSMSTAMVLVGSSRAVSPGMLVDAFDAAAFIAQRSDRWDASTVLAHKEIRVLAVKEANDNLARRRRATPHSIFAFPRNRRAYADLGDQQVELNHCDKMLAEAQSTGGLDGLWNGGVRDKPRR